jgi:glycosyltransferase involved in cell wall biosynthesis
MKISVVIPSFNQGHFIEATLQSIIDQNAGDVEIIVMDGGSTDNTIEILEKYQDHIAFWTSAPDDGQADAINKGFAIAKGDILCWLNSDDIYLPDALRKVRQHFLTTQADVVYGNKILIDEQGRKIGERSLSSFLPRWLYESYLCGGFGIYQPAAFWTKRIYQISGPVDKSFRFCMDNDLFNRFVLTKAKFAFLPQQLAGFRIHVNSKTSNQMAIANEERARLYERDVVGRKVNYPTIRRHLARIYRGLWMLRHGGLLKFLATKLTSSLKWVP